MTQDQTPSVVAPNRMSLRRAREREKSERALSLRIAGASLQAIANQMGYKDPSGARLAVERALMARNSLEDVEQLKEIIRARLDDMLLSIWAKVRTGDLESIDRALRIIDRRSKFDGLDAPTKIAGPDGGAIRIAVESPRQTLLARIDALSGRLEEPKELEGEIIDVNEAR